LSETEALLRLSGGDGRKLLNIFELVVNASNEDEILITNDLVFLVQQNTVLYDKTGEQHYDIVSAFIKSIRGSDPNGAVYWRTND
jgi:putative ATPase